MYFNKKKREDKIIFYWISQIMKKYEDKQIKFYLKQYPFAKTIPIDCSIHTNIHLLKIFVCKQLKLSSLEASI